MKAIVTAQALILLPGQVVRLSDAEARERRHCMEAIGNGLYRANLENHFKKGQTVEFEGDIPKQFLSSCEAIGDDGRPIQATTGERKPTAPAAATVRGTQAASSSDAGGNDLDRVSKSDLDSMTKAELIDFAEGHQVEVSADMNKTAIILAIRKKVKIAA